MTPEARLAAVIELLGEIDGQDRPADLVAGAYLKARRYIGAKDRKAISDRLWGILRRRARLKWWLAAQGVASTGRAMLLADLVLNDRQKPDEIAAHFAGGVRGPGGLNSEERSLLQALSGRDPFHHDMPAWVRGEYPQWLEPRLATSLGDRLAVEMGALRDEAPVDLRVNTLKTDRPSAAVALAEAGLEAKPTVLSPIGLRLPARLSLTVQAAFREGLVEVQDEGSQLVALLVDARPGQTVADDCAGAGGKTLALAATMENKGRLFACDVNERRAAQAVMRMRRAGVHNVGRRLLEGDSDKWVKRQAGSFDRVLVDAPLQRNRNLAAQSRCQVALDRVQSGRPAGAAGPHPDHRRPPGASGGAAGLRHLFTIGRGKRGPDCRLSGGPRRLCHSAGRRCLGGHHRRHLSGR